MLLRKLFRTARQYKAQFISMVIMVAIGVGVFLGFNIEWKSIEEDTNAFFEETNYADFRLYSDNGFSKDDIDTIADIDGVSAATRFFSINASVKDTKKSVALMSGENDTVSTVYVTSGAEYDDSSDGIWLSDRFAEENDLKIGDTLTLTYKGAEISGEIVGLCKSGEMMICTADENQLMPDFETFGFAFISPAKLEKALGYAFYPQINIISDLSKEDMEQKISDALGRTVMVTPKDDHTSYAGAKSEEQEGKSMGSILPVLFLAIGILTMVTTMHRIAANEKTQIGTLKALGFRDRKIIIHYTSYGLVTGLVGTAFGVLLGYGIAAGIMSENGMMATYFDLPEWKLVMPGFCIPVIILTVLFLTLISYLSVKEMLKGTAADSLRPYTPKKMKKTALEKTRLWEKLPFGTRWNLRDASRHKSRSGMTLFGIVGCMVLLVAAFGMEDTMDAYLGILDETSNYSTKISLSDTSTNETAKELADEVSGEYASSSGISYNGKTVTLEIYGEGDKVKFIDKQNDEMQISDDGIYLCQRLADGVSIGDYIEFSPYGSDETYTVRVAGFVRSTLSESVVMTEKYAEQEEISYRITEIYTDKTTDEIADSDIISGKQDKTTLMETYDSFMDIMDLSVAVLIAASIILGVIVLYNLGIMSYIERSRELATLKVLGFRDKKIGRLLISQNMWLTVLGAVLGLPAGVGALYLLIKELASEYELKMCLGIRTYAVSILLTFGVSLAVGFAVARKNRKIDMVGALKSAE